MFPGLKRASSSRTSKGEKKAKPAEQRHSPFGPNDITHANEQNDKCRLFFNFESGMKIREGDALIVNFMDQKFIVEASESSEESIQKMNYHYFK